MIKLIREDYESFSSSEEEEGRSESASERSSFRENNEIQFRKEELGMTVSKECFMRKFSLPGDSVIKLSYQGMLIPWSMLNKRELEEVEVRVCRPHQNVKPQISEGPLCTTEVLLRKKVKELEGRISCLEAVADPSITSAKTERDLQLLTKQITFLAKRLGEADQAEWIKKP